MKDQCQKFDDAFKAKKGICYIDRDGRGYCYDDLAVLTDPATVSRVYEALSGGSPEEDLEHSWSFRKCPRCGHWMYSSESLFSRRRGFVCMCCTPLRTNGKIRLTKDPYDDDRSFYKSSHALFRPGLTTLIGCNGIGKTTLLRNIEEELSARGTPVIKFDNVGENSGQGLFGRMMARAAVNSEYSMGDAVCVWSSSEGERIRESFIMFVNEVIPVIKAQKGYGEFWILFDALDSGLSVDVIEDMKRYVFRQMLADLELSIQLYIIISSNSYEMSEGTNCFSVARCKYLPAATYAKYKKEVLFSAQYKAKRDDVFRIKRKIAELPREFIFNEDMAVKYGGHTSFEEGVVASMAIRNYRLVLYARGARYYGARAYYKLYRQTEDCFAQIPCTDMDADFGFRLDKKDIEETMAGYLCARIYKDVKKSKAEL